MATTIVSNLADFADVTGHANQGHLQFATNQARWRCFYALTKSGATVVKNAVSSSNDLTSATWAGSTDSPAFPSSHTYNGNEQRNLTILNLTNGTTDAFHVSTGLQTTVNNVEHVRCTNSGASALSYDAWTEFNSGNGSSLANVEGCTLAEDSGGLIFETSPMLSADFANGYPTTRISTNADTGATWTNAWGTRANPDSVVNNIETFALASLGSGNMLVVYSNGAVAPPNTTGLKYNTYLSGLGWQSAGTTTNGTTSQDQNDFCLVPVDTTHIYAIRRSGTNTFDWSKYGSPNWSTPANGIPNQNHKAGSGIAWALDGSGNFYLFVLDSAANQPVQYIKCSSANGATPTWGTWTQLEAAGSTARNYISACPNANNNQIGVIWTQVNGVNFDIMLSVLTISAPVAGPPAHIVTTAGWVF